MNDTTKAAADALDGIEPSAWQHKHKDEKEWANCSKVLAEWMIRAPSEFAGHEVRPLYDRAIVRAAAAMNASPKTGGEKF